MSNRTFDSFTVGQTETLEVELTAEMHRAFVALSGDDAPLHTDEAYAKSRGFEGVVVHGAMVGALVSRFVGTVFPGRNSLLQKLELRFKKPCYAPTRLTLRGEVMQLTEAFETVALKTLVTDADGRRVVDARTVHLLLPDPDAGPDGDDA